MSPQTRAASLRRRCIGSASPPIEFTSLIRLLVERTPGEHLAEAILAANVDERVGWGAIAIRQRQRGVNHPAVVRAPRALQLVEPRQRGVVDGVKLARHLLAAWIRHDDGEANLDHLAGHHLVGRCGDGFAQKLGARQKRVVRVSSLESAVDEYSIGHGSPPGGHIHCQWGLSPVDGAEATRPELAGYASGASRHLTAS